MDQTKIWQYFQNEQKIGDRVFNSESRYRFIARRIDPGKEVLNIGVGRGGLEKVLIEKNVSVSCLDPSEESITNLRNLYDLGNKARVGFSQDIPFKDNRFDIVVMSEVLEHLGDDILEKSLSEIHRVLRPGGRFFGTVPANEELTMNLVVCPDCGKVFHRWGHVQCFSEERLRTILLKKFSEPRLTRQFFGDYRSLNWKGRITWTIKKLMVASGVKGFGETFFFSANKTSK